MFRTMWSKSCLYLRVNPNPISNSNIIAAIIAIVSNVIQNRINSYVNIDVFIQV